ncbi:NAD(P)-dependent dehydrogenase (short-subunit alcohol dehydrogenase family) [Silvimonas terrae]|uniref:NAD(P)-dependent dehydrogenase (Short-subunit alcohol dehydrogenase family) n=1 Tax=Silvimonas terrae TaxID=300266 RepID=A0A840RE32_9NEIS|nr:SDR family oxidoreductase [Silvimonas terrae]MBB5191237.1 NAD(P)-dependent dehydrogenase (short-subunit alcohol dehydrogenase family) [Silvimonas terrae]
MNTTHETVLPFMPTDLAGQVAVVTGAGGVLCSELASVLAYAGMKVALLDLNPQAAEAIAARLRDAGCEAIGIGADVLQRDSLEHAAARIEAELGPCTLLLNGAGGNHPKGTTSKEWLEPGDLADPSLTSFFDLDPAGIGFVFNLNFLGTLLPTQVFARQMLQADGLARPGSTVINVSSMNAFCPLTKIPAYSAAKAAVSNFTQWLAVHFCKTGIRVNAIAPGFFLTAQNHKLLFDETSGEPTARAGKILAHTPMGRFGQSAELSGTTLWLASPAASGFVNGVVIPVDGGFAAYSGV